MTPGQIFTAERKLRELNQVTTAIDVFPSYIFSASVEHTTHPTKTVPAFIVGNSDLSKMLRDAASAWLVARKDALAEEIHAMGVDISVTNT